MKILFVTRRFFPHGDATSSVVYNLAEALKNNNINVHVAALTSTKEDQDIHEWGQLNISNVYCSDTKTAAELKQDFNKNPISAIYTAMRIVANQLVMRMIPEYRGLSINPLLAKAYLKYFRQFRETKKYDLCIITFMPTEAVWAALKVNLKMPLAILQLDTYWNNDMLPKQYLETRVKFEKKIIRKCRFVTTTPIIYKEDIIKFPRLTNRLIPTEFPMVKPPNCDAKPAVFNDGLIHCIFLGTLYPGLRPPEKVVHFISKTNSKELIFDFYGTRQDLIASCPEYKKTNDRINLHGSVSSEQAEALRNSADILVNIDNTSCLQVPSKIFEYFSSCRPILNFYFDESSPALEYFKCYPLCININLNKIRNSEIPISAKSIINMYNARKPSFEEIRNRFIKCTPDYVARQFIEAYNSTIE